MAAFMPSDQQLTDALKAAVQAAVDAAPGSAIENLFVHYELQIIRTTGTEQPYCMCCYKWSEDEYYDGGHKTRNYYKIDNRDLYSMSHRLKWACDTALTVSKDEPHAQVAMEAALWSCPEALQIFRHKLERHQALHGHGVRVPGPPAVGPPGVPPPFMAAPPGIANEAVALPYPLTPLQAELQEEVPLLMGRTAELEGEVQVLMGRTAELEGEVRGLRADLEELKASWQPPPW